MGARVCTGSRWRKKRRMMRALSFGRSFKTACEAPGTTANWAFANYS